MTKNFCDKCGKEVEDRKYVRISFTGSTTEEGFVFKNVTFCETCYVKVEKVVEKALTTPSQKKSPDRLHGKGWKILERQ